MRGRFANAAASDKLLWSAIQAWLVQCKANDQSEMQRKMAAAGIANPQAEGGPFDDLVCDEVGIAIPHLETDRIEEFQSIVGPANLTAASIGWTVNAARDLALDGKPLIQDQLRGRVLIDQLLRKAAIADHFDGAVLSKDQIAIVKSLIWLAIRKADRDNTAWLTAVVDREGWIDAEKYGDQASEDAWLLLQHADQAPLFQYRVLRDLDPARNPGKPKLSRRSYAFLTDRVMLKITGRQIYGSQLICRAGNWVPFPIEDEAHVDSRRSQMGLGPIQPYIDNFVRDVGKCTS